MVVTVLPAGMLATAGLLGWWKLRADRRKWESRQRPCPVRKALSDHETKLYYRLLQMLRWRPVLVAFKMRVQDVVDAAEMRSLPYNERQYAFRAHFDFVVVDKRTKQPLVAIELDDSSHRDLEVAEKDRMKNGVCRTANFPLIRVPVWDSPQLQVVLSHLPQWWQA